VHCGDGSTYKLYVQSKLSLIHHLEDSRKNLSHPTKQAKTKSPGAAISAILIQLLAIHDSEYTVIGLNEQKSLKHEKLQTLKSASRQKRHGL
jgi:hypothetical protein